MQAGNIVTFRTAADVLYRYDAEDVLVNRSEVWANVPSPRTDLGWEWSNSSRDENHDPIEPPADGSYAWSVRDLHFIRDGERTWGYYADGGVLTRLVEGPDGALIARQTTSSSTAASGTKWYATDRQRNVLGLINTTQTRIGETTNLIGSWAKVVWFRGGSGASDRWSFAKGFHDEFEAGGRYTDSLRDIGWPTKKKFCKPASREVFFKTIGVAKTVPAIAEQARVIVKAGANVAEAGG